MRHFWHVSHSGKSFYISHFLFSLLTCARETGGAHWVFIMDEVNKTAVLFCVWANCSSGLTLQCIHFLTSIFKSLFLYLNTP